MRQAQIIATGEVINVDTSIESKNGTLWHVFNTQTYIFEKELRFFNLSQVENFIETWHPDFHHCDEIAWIDDLACILDDEGDDDKLARIRHNWGSKPSDWIRNKMKLEIDVFARSLTNYYRNLYGNATSED